MRDGRLLADEGEIRSEVSRLRRADTRLGLDAADRRNLAVGEIGEVRRDGARGSRLMRASTTVF